MLNHITIMGRLTADPELRQTASGTSCVSFTLAVDRDYKPEGGERETDFIPCVAWRSTADFIAKYFSKGSSICITGSIQTRTWEDKNGGKRYATEVNVDEAYFVESKSDGQAPAPAFQTPVAPNFEEVSGDDDLPF